MSRLALAVDDADVVLITLGRNLTKLGYEVITAGNGVEGFERARERLPGLVVSDLEMPGLNGIDFYSRFRGLDGALDVPFVLSSGNEELLNITVKPYRSDANLRRLVKPYSITELKEVLDSFERV